MVQISPLILKSDHVNKTKMIRHPHRNRRTNIHIWLLCLIGFIIFLACSCSPKFGCPAHTGKRYMSGYGLNQQTSNKIRKLIDKYGGAWVYCPDTHILGVFNPEGKLIGYYHECN